jgi:hypothetical protein
MAAGAQRIGSDGAAGRVGVPPVVWPCLNIGSFTYDKADTILHSDMPNHSARKQDDLFGKRSSACFLVLFDPLSLDVSSTGRDD